MPYGGNDWLSLTPEMAVEPDLPICDPHHHLWDKRYERIPYQRYLIEDLLSDINSDSSIDILDIISLLTNIVGNE